MMIAMSILRYVQNMYLFKNAETRARNDNHKMHPKKINSTVEQAKQGGTLRGWVPGYGRRRTLKEC